MPKKPLADPQPFVVRRSGIQGKGGFATRLIKKGERIAEYVGERISWKEADRRYDDEGMRRHHTFLFSVNSRTVIDAATQGGDSRFINHSCDPNCEAVDDRGRIFIEAIKDIPAGSELFYDYAYARDEDTTEEDEKLYVCLCGSPKCRGSILEPPKKVKKLPPHHAAARHPHESTGSKRSPSKKKGTTRPPAKKQGTTRSAAKKQGTTRSAAKKQGTTQKRAKRS